MARLGCLCSLCLCQCRARMGCPCLWMAWPACLCQCQAHRMCFHGESCRFWHPNWICFHFLDMLLFYFRIIQRIPAQTRNEHQQETCSESSFRWQKQSLLIPRWFGIPPWKLTYFLEHLVVGTWHFLQKMIPNFIHLRGGTKCARTIVIHGVMGRLSMAENNG